VKKKLRILQKSSVFVYALPLTGLLWGAPKALSSGYPPSSSKEIHKIMFGSCSQQERDQPLWPVITSESPDVFLMIGDNIYADTTDAKIFNEKYSKLGAQPDFALFRQKIPLLATWDDHDYGLNDGGSEFSAKEISKTEFLKFWGFPAGHEVFGREGIYHSVTMGPKGRLVQFILLDTRTFRGALKKGSQGYIPNEDPQSSLLGEAQWKWLEEELLKPADVRILVSSIQLVSSEHPFEKWSNQPREKTRLFDLVKKTKAQGLFVISGDRHQGEISKLPASETGFYDLYDFTSSGMTEKGRGTRHEKNPWRIGADKAYVGTQFGEILIHWDAKPSPTVDLVLRDQNKVVVSAVQVPFKT
jgi:alkaline phosphatase D